MPQIRTDEWLLAAVACRKVVMSLERRFKALGTEGLWIPGRSAALLIMGDLGVDFFRFALGAGLDPEKGITFDPRWVCFCERYPLQDIGDLIEYIKTAPTLEQTIHEGLDNLFPCWNKKDVREDVRIRLVGNSETLARQAWDGNRKVYALGRNTVLDCGAPR